MATRLILDELDLNLSALATGLVIVIVVVVGAHAVTLGSAVVSGAVTGGLLQVVLGGRRVLLTDGSDVGHDGNGTREGGRRGGAGEGGRGLARRGTRREKAERESGGESEDAQRGMMLLRGRENDQIE